MCRALAYLGEPLALADLLHRPKHSLVAQSYDPQQLNTLNLAGLGLVAWTDAHRDALVYRSTTVPIYDTNLASLAQHVRSRCVLAHVRGIPYRSDAGFGAGNLHPFLHEPATLALAHNGDLAHFDRLKPALAKRLDRERLLHIRGTTDSEWIYALLLQYLGSETVTVPSLASALTDCVSVLREAREEAGIDTASSMNLFFSNGEILGVARYTFDFGRYELDQGPPDPSRGKYLSLWYSTGARFEAGPSGRWGLTATSATPQTLLCASEPLSADPAGWVEVPEYSAVIGERIAEGVKVHTVALEGGHALAR